MQLAAEKTLEIQTGLKNKANEVSFTLMTHHGDVAVNSKTMEWYL